MLNISDLIKSAESSANTFTWSNTTSAYSVSIVNSSNGKRVTFSKSLCQKLSIGEEVYILPCVESNVILVSGVKFSDKAQVCSVKGSDKKLSYNAELVKKLTENFKLDFTGITSKSFNDISIEDFEGMTISTVKLSNGVS